MWVTARWSLNDTFTFVACVDWLAESASFDQIRQASTTTPAVLIRELDAIRRVAPRLPDDCRQLLRLFGRFAWKLKPVSKPRFGHDIAGLCRIFLNFVAQLAYQDAKVCCHHSVVRSPDSLHDSLM